MVVEKELQRLFAIAAVRTLLGVVCGGAVESMSGSMVLQMV